MHWSLIASLTSSWNSCDNERRQLRQADQLAAEDAEDWGMEAEDDPHGDLRRRGRLSSSTSWG